MEAGLVERLRGHQEQLPGMDGYTAQKLEVGFSGGVELLTNDATEVDFINGLNMWEDVTITVTATVVNKGFGAIGKQGDGQGVGYGVRLKVHSLEVR